MVVTLGFSFSSQRDELGPIFFHKKPIVPFTPAFFSFFG
jgi:hypothetical protein